MRGVYYNDIEPFACAALRRNIARGRLGAGRVDDRSIVEVQPADLDGFTVCHFFAGIGGFELARLMAGWPDDRELWTGGFPCQDISCAGKGEGITGERSGLWFQFLRLIRSCRPARLLIENVPALRTRGADEVLDGLEREGYSARPIVVGAWAVGAPHRRNRVWIVCELSDAHRDGLGRIHGSAGQGTHGPQLREHAHGQSESNVADGDGGGFRTERPTSGRRSYVDERGQAVADAQRARRGAGAGEPRDQTGAGGGRDQSQPGSETGLVHAAGSGLEGHGADSGKSQGCQPRRAGASDCPGWPARPGEPQHEWEEPRLVYARRAGRRKDEPGAGAESRAAVHGPDSGGNDRGPASSGSAQPALGAATHGLPERLAGRSGIATATAISGDVRQRPAWRRHSLKAVGNAIVPQVAAEVLRAWRAA